MKISIHPDAAMNYNKKAIELVADIKPYNEPYKKSKFKSEIHPAWTMTDKDIIGDIKEFIFNLSDRENNLVGKVFQKNDIELGLYDEGYKNLVKLSNSIQKSRDFRNIISTNFTINTIFDWIKQKYNQEIDLSMMDYFINKAEENIKEYEVWIPIGDLEIQSDLEIGKITIKPIRKEVFDNWYNISTLCKNKEYEKQVDEFYEQLRQDVQGRAAATLKICAEKDRAQEIALEEAKKSLSILRVYSPPNFSPFLISDINVYKQVTTERIILIHNNENFNMYHGLVNETDLWEIDNNLINHFNNGGPKILSKILKLDILNDYQEKLLNAIYIYSKNTLRDEVYDKLLYILISLESLLLRNENEPIMQNISERMAFIVDKTPEGRQKIVRLVKDIYSIRSKFIHHGICELKNNEDMEKIKNFMDYAQQVFDILIIAAFKINSKDDLLGKIEQMKFS